ncbi:hypothetical protein EV424DRAFT_1603607 [Suillus variegatus]|nr:hypothetical protein EV424DRAFT_1603607 [Suillus variegatus]
MLCTAIRPYTQHRTPPSPCPPPIRPRNLHTNAYICIGRMGYNAKRRVLAPAFGKVLKDRVVWVMAFITTAACFEMDDIAAGEEYVDDVFVGGYEVGQGSDGWRRMDIFARGYWQVELDVVLRLGREVIESQAATAIIDAGTTFVITSYSIARSYYPNVSGATAHTEGADACWTTKLLILSTIFNFVDVCICAVPCDAINSTVPS